MAFGKMAGGPKMAKCKRFKTVVTAHGRERRCASFAGGGFGKNRRRRGLRGLAQGLLNKTPVQAVAGFGVGLGVSAGVNKLLTAFGPKTEPWAGRVTKAGPWISAAAGVGAALATKTFAKTGHALTIGGAVGALAPPVYGLIAASRATEQGAIVVEPAQLRAIVAEAASGRPVNVKLSDGSMAALNAGAGGGAGGVQVLSGPFGNPFSTFGRR